MTVTQFGANAYPMLKSGLTADVIDQARRDFETRGWHLAADVLDPAFVEGMSNQAKVLFETGEDLDAGRFSNRKQQFVWQPDTVTVEGLCKTIAALSGADEERLVLGERHFKCYHPDAPALVPAHKDRSASQVTVGFAIDVPEGSRLLLWPDGPCDANTFPSTARYRDTRRGAQRPEVALEAVEPVSLDTQPGDIVLFRGDAIYHERLNPGGAIVLFCKFNVDGLDPLGEDPRTLQMEAASADLTLETARSVRVSRRVTGISATHLRPTWTPVWLLEVLDAAEAVVISESEAAVMRRMPPDDGVPLSDFDSGELGDIERLVEVGGLLLGV